MSSYEIALSTSTAIVFTYSILLLQQFFPADFHRISPSQAFAVIVSFTAINLFLGPIIGLICSSLFSLGDMYYPITGALAGVWGGIIGTCTSVFAWSVYSANRNNKSE